MGRRGFDRMRSPRAAAMIALASATGQARTLPASRTGAGGMMPCSMQFLMLSVLRGLRFGCARVTLQHRQAGRRVQNRLICVSSR
jgi:hypothetical protein